MITTFFLLTLLCVLLPGAAITGNYIVGVAVILFSTGIFIFGLESIPPAVSVGLGAIVVVLEAQLILLFREKRISNTAQFAKQDNIDLIVVGSHGRHGLALLLGSTANGVLHGANCDVLAVRVKEQD